MIYDMSIQILAFNTTTDLCSVAIMLDKHVYTYNIISPRCHAEKILFMIDKLLSEVGTTLRALDYIIFDRGPGSFIGVRIGIGIAQGLSLGADLPLIEVSSLAVLAQGAKRVFNAKNIITTIDARVGELYWAWHFESENGIWIYNHNVMVAQKMCLQKLIYSVKGNWVLVGTGWNKYTTLAYTIPGDSIVLRSMMFPEAQDMLVIGIDKSVNNLFIELDCIEPIYLYKKIYSKNRIFNR